MKILKKAECIENECLLYLHVSFLIRADCRLEPSDPVGKEVSY